MTTFETFLQNGRSKFFKRHKLDEKFPKIFVSRFLKFFKPARIYFQKREIFMMKNQKIKTKKVSNHLQGPTHHSHLAPLFLGKYVSRTITIFSTTFSTGMILIDRILKQKIFSILYPAASHLVFSPHR